LWFRVRRGSFLGICLRIKRRNSSQRNRCVMNRGFMDEKNRKRTRWLTRLARAGAVGALFVAWISPAYCQIVPQSSDAEDLTLKRAVELALQNSRELTLARLQYTVALNQSKLDVAEFRPTFIPAWEGFTATGFRRRRADQRHRSSAFRTRSN
jgi:hypothetical protein